MRVIEVTFILGIDEETKLGLELADVDEVDAAMIIAAILNNHHKGTNQHAPFHVITARGRDLDIEQLASYNQINREDSGTT